MSKIYGEVEFHNFLPWYYMEVNGYLHAPATLPSKKQFGCHGEEKSSYSCSKWNPNSSTFNPVA
jgi:hypothetical protein